jgi:2-polyprenyl-6-methoxyphenol hydroxylase-like FAD-dependent oxidoreductase
VTGWFGNPQWAGAFPTDSGLTGYYIMPTKDRLPKFKEDLEASIREVISDQDGAPPVDELTLVGDIIGDVELPGFVRPRYSGRVALVGDAALTSDPLFGVGAGWAFESAGWLADAVTPALAGDVSMDAALKRYKSVARRALFPHAFQVQMYASGRKFDPMERLLFRTAARDQKIAAEFQHVGMRSAKGSALLRPSMQARMLRTRLRKSAIPKTG